MANLCVPVLAYSTGSKWHLAKHDDPVGIVSVCNRVFLKGKCVTARIIDIPAADICLKCLGAMSAVDVVMRKGSPAPRELHQPKEGQREETQPRELHPCTARIQRDGSSVAVEKVDGND
jgi:hypothetical protein